MLKWAMRIVAVGGTLLALAVGTAAWMHRTEGRIWRVATPSVCTDTYISPRSTYLNGWLRRDWDPVKGWNVGRYGLVSDDWTDPLRDPGHFAKVWHGFGVARDDYPNIGPSYAEILCPTWAAIAVLLLPMGLWAGIGWRQRRRVKAGHCVNCGYDLRATPEKCPECGRAVTIRAV